MDKFELVKKEIEKITKSAPLKIEYPHSQSVYNLVLKLKPDASIPLKIAALGHDIDRSLLKERIKPEDFPNNYAEYKKQHSIKSAKIISELMKKYLFDNSEIEKAKFIIENHEVGGKGDVEILKEADSISFFKDNLSYYKEKYPLHFKGKINFMYSRLSEKGKKLVLHLIKESKLKDEVMDIISK